MNCMTRSCTLAGLKFWLLAALSLRFTQIKAEQHPATADEGPLSEVQTAVGLEVALPCDLMPSNMMTDKVQLVIWYREGTDKPIYTFDARGRSLHQAIPWADENVFKNKAHFYYDTNPPALRIKNIQTTDAGLYKCRVDFHKSPTRNWRINVTVLVPPRKLIILDHHGAEIRDQKAGPYLEGDSINLTCLSSGGIPPPRVSWWREHALVDDSFQVLPDGSVRNVLHLKNLLRKDLLTTYTCQASNGHVVAALTKKVVLDMNLPPLSLLLQGLNHAVIAGTRTHVTCTSIGARPPPQIIWSKGGQIVKGSTYSTSTDGNTTVSELILVPVPEDNERQVVCSISLNPSMTSQHLPEGQTTVTTVLNNGNTGLYLKDSRILNVTHAPIVALSLGAPLDPNNLMKGSDVYLECEVKANPSITKVEWYHNDKQLHSSRGVIISNQTLVLQGISKSSHGQYFCRATNMQGSVSSNEVYLDVKYPPVCKSEPTIIRAALKQTINITCQVDANPLDNLIYKWHFNNSLENLIELPLSSGSLGLSDITGIAIEQDVGIGVDGIGVGGSGAGVGSINQHHQQQKLQLLHTMSSHPSAGYYQRNKRKHLYVQQQQQQQQQKQQTFMALPQATTKLIYGRHGRVALRGRTKQHMMKTWSNIHFPENANSHISAEDKHHLYHDDDNDDDAADADDNQHHNDGDKHNNNNENAWINGDDDEQDIRDELQVQAEDEEDDENENDKNNWNNNDDKENHSDNFDYDTIINNDNNDDINGMYSDHMIEQKSSHASSYHPQMAYSKMAYKSHLDDKKRNINKQITLSQQQQQQQQHQQKQQQLHLPLIASASALASASAAASASSLSSLSLHDNMHNNQYQLSERKRLAALHKQQQQQQQQQLHHHQQQVHQLQPLQQLHHRLAMATTPPPPLNNVYDYHIDTYESFGAISCVAVSPMGQSQSCWYHIQPADLPDSVKNCTSYNATANSIQVQCMPGYDGGIPQHFHVQIYDELNRQILYNISYRNPEFTIKRLPSDSVFVIRITAVNGQGSSKMAYRLRARTLSAPLLRTASSTAVLVQLTPLLGALVGVIATLVLVAICIVIFMKFRTKNNRRGPSDDTTTTEADKGSAEPLSRNMGSHSSLEDKNPDVIPQETNSEDEFHLEEKAFDRLNLESQRIIYTPTNRLNTNSPPPPSLSPTFGKPYGELSLTTNPAFSLYNTPQRAPATQRPVYTAPPPLLSTRTPANIYTRIPTGRTYLPAYETRTSPTSPYGSTTTCTMPLLSGQSNGSLQTNCSTGPSSMISGVGGGGGGCGGGGGLGNGIGSGIIGGGISGMGAVSIASNSSSSNINLGHCNTLPHPATHHHQQQKQHQIQLQQHQQHQQHQQQQQQQQQNSIIPTALTSSLTSGNITIGAAQSLLTSPRSHTAYGSSSSTIPIAQSPLLNSTTLLGSGNYETISS